jgi:D-alanyl-D-alanine carboxypeptidase/D-alanyl-D-alanine-endopeptidase (penicillin-binding protein 4)
VRSLAQSWGVAFHGRIADGSGLSRLDRLDATTLIGWLRALDAQGLGTEMRKAMPVSCRSGTLKRRLCGRYLSGHVRAKTGTLDNTSALAGWATTRSGGEVAFAIVVDGPRASRDRAAIDAALTKLLRSTAY